MDLTDLWGSPDAYLWQFDGQDAVFRRMTRDTYFNSIFTDQRIVSVNDAVERVSISELLGLLPSATEVRPADAWIFHMAHCGSTLLSRGVDTLDQNLVYREPFALRQLAVQAASTDSRLPSWYEILRLVTGLLGRAYDPSGPVIVKANVPVNFIIRDILDLVPSSGAILLYANLDDYVISVLKTAKRRAWLRRIVSRLAVGLSRALNIGVDDIESSSDAALAGCLWSAQYMIYRETLLSSHRVVSLHSETFFNDPESTLRATFQFLNQDVEQSRLREIVTGDVFAKYSKNPAERYSNEDRLKRRDDLRIQLSRELEEARSFVETNFQDFDWSPLPSSLL